MHHVPGAPARRSNGTRDEIGPRVDIACRVANHGGFSRRSTGCMDPNDLVAWHCEHAKRVAGAQILFRREREVSKVLQRLQVLRVNAGKLTFAPVCRYVLVGVAKRPLEPLQLQRAQLILAGALDGLQVGCSGTMLGSHSLRIMAL